MILRRSHFLFLILIMTLVSFMSISVSVAHSGVNAKITGIDVKEVNGSTEIEIKSTSPLNYTVYKPTDPYIVVVELQDADLGEFTEKIVVDRAGVLEIIPSEVEGMANVIRLEIALTVPAEVKPLQKKGSLVLAFINPEAEEVAAAEPVSEEEEIKDAEVIEGIDFSRSGDRLLVTISGDGKMSTKVFQPDNKKIVVDIPGVTTTIEAPKVYEPPMGGIRIGKLPDKTRIVLDLTEPTEYEVSSEGKEVVVSLKIPVTEPVMAKAESPLLEEKVSEAIETGVKPCVSGESGKYIGETISLDFQDADLIHIFRLLADVSGCNIVVSPKVKGKFSMRLKDVPWDQALDVILRNYELSKRVEGNVIRIAPTSVIAREEEAIAKAKEAQEKAGNLVTKVYPINFADVKKVESSIKSAKILTKRGSISVDERTSSVIIKDVEQNHTEFKKLIKALDKPTPQVSIDARIVEVTTNFTRELGIQWGAQIRPSSNTQIGGLSLTEGNGFSSNNPFIVNLPAAVQSGSGGAIGFGYIGAGALRSLDLQLSAMESTGQGRIISNPRIITTDNQKATIQQGQKIPYQTVSAEGTQTQFVDANLELTVTPHITPDGTIVMDVQAKKNEADFGQTVQGVPSINTKEAETQVLIKDGDTLVIGGIFKTKTDLSESYVPGLGKIPILGWLFKTKKKIHDTTELLIFITPRIVK